MMIKYLSFIHCTLIMAQFDACQQVYSQESLEPFLEVRWLHSHEEDHENHQIFRPEHFAFPPSRGRTGFELKPNGKGFYGSIRPQDGIVWEAAQWRVVNPGIIEIKVVPKASRTWSRYRYGIVDLRKDRLALTFLSHKSGDGL